MARFVAFVSHSCPACKLAKGHIEELGCEVVWVDEEEGLRLARERGIRYVPSVLDTETGEVHVGYLAIRKLAKRARDA